MGKIVQQAKSVDALKLLNNAIVTSRLYPPESYGTLATYMSYSVVFGTLGNWQYAQAIVIDHEADRAPL